MTSTPSREESIQAPVFLVWDNGEVQAFPTAGQAEGSFCFYEDAKDGGGRAWDSRGIPLDLNRAPEDTLELALSAKAPELDELRILLVASLRQVGVEIPAEASATEVLETAAQRFTMRSTAWPCVVLLVPLAVAAMCGITYLIFGR